MRNIFSTTTIGLLAALLALVATGCEDPSITQPDSLEAPTSMTVADGEVCLPRIGTDDSTIGPDPLPFCGDGDNGFGLVVNQRSGRLAVAALGQSRRQMVNLDRGRPGISHIPVGARPVDVATTGDDTAAIVANQAGQTLTGVDLWTLQPLEDRLPVDGTPRRVASFGPEGDESVALLTGGPDRLEVRGGLECGRPAYVDDRRDHDPAQNCEWDDVDPGAADLPGQPVDMAVDETDSRAWVVYRDRSELSWVALDDEGLGEDESCLAGGAPPCEVDRVDWPTAGSSEVGATSVDADPLGLFVYVVDRSKNRLYVFDRQRQRLVDASEAIEPPLAPLEDNVGVPLVRSATAMSSDLSRRILDDNLVLYRFGVRVAANNGQLYRVGAVDVECRYEGDEPISNEEFFFDDQARAQTDEAECLDHLPELPLGGDPDFDDDDELLADRIVEPEESDVSLAITPIFGLRDGEPRDGQLRQPRCNQPQEFLNALNEADDGQGVGCGSGLAPQPISTDIDDDLDSYADQPRADLMTFARALFDDDGEAGIDRSIFDLRLLNERWTVAYEGELPRPGDSGSALISRDEPGLLLSGGTEYCSAGVQEGDHLTIRRGPADAEGCEVFEADDPLYRTYRIDELRPYEIELAVLEDEDDRVDELPTRECFDQGLTYRVRPDDQWLVTGVDSGVVSRYERDGNECVLRDGADDPQSRIQSRVETGEQYAGPYLRFLLREGDVEPERGLRYSFEVARNFSRDARTHVSDDGRPTMPSDVVFTPDLGDGRLVTVVDSGGDRIFIRNLTLGDQPTQFIR